MIEKQNTLVIMPARGGSKRIPRKNIKLIGGKQMLRWPLEELLSIFDAQQILVSTEDKEIRKIALEYGISLPYSRPASLADDFVGTREVAVDALQWYETNYRAVDYVLIVYPTAVKLQSAMLKSAFEQIKMDARYEKVITVSRFRHPIERAFIIDSNKRARMANPEFAMTRSQDLSDKYFDAGQFYLYNKSALYNKNDAETLCTAVILDSLHSIDIDTEEDLQMAEAIMNIHKPFLS